MTTELQQILVFKTNIQTESQLHDVQAILDKHPHVRNWSIDQQDVDCVLRVVTPKLCNKDVVELVSRNGYYCEELDD